MKFSLALSVNATPFSFFPEPEFALGFKLFASGSFFSSIQAGLSKLSILFLSKMSSSSASADSPTL
jgi:hypothetical protein